MAMYKQVKFLCNGQEKDIVCAGHDGSSALEAIFNCFCVENVVTREVSQELYIAEEEVKSILTKLMSMRIGEMAESDISNFDHLEDCVNDHNVLLELIQKFEPNTHMVPILSSASSFEASNIRCLTNLLNLHVLHAWVVNRREKSIYESVRHYTFERLKLYYDLIQDEATEQDRALIQGLLESGKKQLTTYGYNCLNETLTDGLFAILYWDNKFNVIHKMHGNLLLLETDIDILDKYPTVVWRIFEEEEKESIYLTCEYVPASDQPNIATANEWYRQKIPNVSGEASNEKDVKDSDGAIPKLSRSQRRRQNRKQKEAKEINQREDHQAEGSLEQKLSQVFVEDFNEKIVKASDESSKDLDHLAEVSLQQKLSQVSIEDSNEKIVKASDETSEDLDHQAEESLQQKLLQVSVEDTNEKIVKASDETSEDLASECLKFFQEFQDGGSKPYFEGIVQAIKHTGSPNVYVPYDSIMRYNKNLASTIIDNYPSISGILTQYLNQYLKEHLIQTDAMLHILHVPEPKSVQSFKSFIEHMDFCEDYDIYGDGVHQSPSYLARKMALGYLTYIVKKFRDGRCFGGKWNELNMMVRGSGSTFVIEGCEDEELSPKAGYLDLKMFDTVVLKLFKNKDGMFPPYFKELQEDFSLIHKCINDPEKWEKFLLLISHPFALKAPIVRSTFLSNIYRAAESECSEPGHVYGPLHIRTDLTDWRINATKLWLFKLNYDHKNFDNGPYTTVYTLTKWQVSHWSLLKYSRHFITHVLRYTMIINKGQQIRDLTKVDILLGRHLGEFISQLIRFFIFNCDINGLFSSPWRHFVESNCSDKPLQNITNVEATTTGEELVSSSSPEKLVTHQTGYAAFEVQRCSTARVSHSFVVRIGDLDLINFMNLLTNHGLKVEQEDGGTSLRCGSIEIHKSYGKIPVNVGGKDFLGFDKKADPSVTVKGPLNDNYLKITGLLSVWLAM